MYKYGTRSRGHLSTTHAHLQMIFEEVLEKHDHSVTCGERLPDVQQAFFNSGQSKVPGRTANGQVNEYPHMPREGGAWAIDVWPYVDNKPVVVPDYSEIVSRIYEGERERYLVEALGRYAQFAFFAAIVMETANRYFDRLPGDPLRLVWGGNWDEDASILVDQGFDDFPHFQMVQG